MSAPRVEPSQPRFNRRQTIELLMERRVPEGYAKHLVGIAFQAGLAPSRRYELIVIMPERDRFVIQDWH